MNKLFFAITWMLVACSSGREDGTVRVDASVARNDAGLRQDARVSLPASCPCPAGAYCDLATNRCVEGCATDRDCQGAEICVDRQCRVGCRGDEECGDGQICDDTETCRAGCRSDEDCAGTVCDPSSLTCRRGCRSNEDCGLEELCDFEAAVCVPGCYSDEDCRPPHSCIDGTCSGECAQNLDCPYDQHCNYDSHECEAGCWPADSTEVYEESASCAPGNSCTREAFNGRTISCDTPPCDWQCTPVCSLHCPDVGGRDFTCFAIWNGQSGYTDLPYCREVCETDSDCPSGDICMTFVTALDRSDVAKFCSHPCRSNADCEGTMHHTIYSCSCDSDGVCRDEVGACPGTLSGLGA